MSDLKIILLLLCVFAFGGFLGYNIGSVWGLRDLQERFRDLREELSNLTTELYDVGYRDGKKGRKKRV
jgi:hypothetical protein